MRPSDINNKTISVTLTDFELAKPEDNTPGKLVMRAIFDDIAFTKNKSNQPIGIVMTDEVRLSVMKEAHNGEMQRFIDGEERLFGLPVETDNHLANDFEVRYE